MHTLKRHSWWLALVLIMGVAVLALARLRDGSTARLGADVCGYTLAPLPVATQQAQQTTLTSSHILSLAYREGRIARDQYYLYKGYIYAHELEQYPAALTGIPGSVGGAYIVETQLDTQDEFCTLSPCVQQELNSLMFSDRLQCVNGTYTVLPPRPRVTVTP